MGDILNVPCHVPVYIHYKPIEGLNLYRCKVPASHVCKPSSLDEASDMPAKAYGGSLPH